MTLLDALFMVFAALAPAQPQLQLIAEPVSATWSSAGTNLVKIEFRTTLTIRNVGTEPALVFTAVKPAVPGVYIGRSQRFVLSELLVRRYLGQSFSGSQEWKDRADRVRRAPLPDSGLNVLLPGQSSAVDYNDVVYVPKSRRDSYDWQNKVTFEQLIEEKELWVSFEAEIWPINLDRDRERLPLARAVAARRRSEGLLATESLLSSPVRLVPGQ